MDSPSQPHDLLQDYLQTLGGMGYRYDFHLKDDAGGQLLLKASPQAQCQFIRMAVAWLDHSGTRSASASPWGVLEAIATLLRRNLPFEQDDMIALLHCGSHDMHAWRIEPHLVKAIGTYLSNHSHTPAFDIALTAYITVLEARTWLADQRRR